MDIFYSLFINDYICVDNREYNFDNSIWFFFSCFWVWYLGIK